jgi:hypothetical protein
MSQTGLSFLAKEPRKMYLEAGRDIVRGIALLIFAAIAQWADLSIGLALIALMGLLILQSAFTDWCPADLFLRPMGLKKKLGAKG